MSAFTALVVPDVPVSVVFLGILSTKELKTTLTFFIFLVLEELLGAELQNVVELLFGHHGSLVAEARPHDQVSQHHLALGHLRDALLNRVARHEAVDEDAVCLANAMCSTERLFTSKKTQPICSNFTPSTAEISTA